MDCGCRSGDIIFVTNEYREHIVGIDISKVSIELAVKYNNSLRTLNIRVILFLAEKVGRKEGVWKKNRK